MEVESTTVQPRVQKLREAARALEGAFLAEMLKSAAPRSADGLGGGIGEEQFGSFLREAQAKQLVEAGGVGLAQSLFAALAQGEEGHA